MKPFRLLLVVAGAVMVLLLVGTAVVFSSAFQTWAARKAFAGETGGRTTIGSVSAGLRRVELAGLRHERPGAVLTVPRVEIDLPVISAGLRDRVVISRLVAKGWTLDLSPPLARSPLAAAGQKKSPVSGADTPAPESSRATTPNAAAEEAFRGIFEDLQLPADLALDGVELEGEVILPELRGHVRLTVTGGGLAAGKQGKFEIVSVAALNHPDLRQAETRGTVLANMDTPRSFTRVEAKLDTTATGARFPNGANLTTTLTAARAAAGEAYSVTLSQGAQPLLHVSADLPRDRATIAGSWKFDLTERDILPLAFGQPLPAFAADGAGAFETDPQFVSIRISGRLSSAVSRLEQMLPALSAIGEVKLAASFDFSRRGDHVVVETLDAALATAAGSDVARVRSLRGFEIDVSTNTVRAPEDSPDLLALTLQGVPLAWLKPFTGSFEASGGALRGELRASAHGESVALHSLGSLTIDDVDLSQNGQTLARRVNVSFAASADYAPAGWQVEVTGLSARRAGATLATLDAKLGQLAGGKQPLKATGRVVADLPAVLTLPFAEGRYAVTSGEAAIDFAASVSAKTEVQARASLQKLTAAVEGKAQALPDIAAELRADIGEDGKIAFRLPILLERGERKSDLTAAGTLSPARDNVRTIEAQVTSANLVLDDARIVSAVLTASDASASAPSSPAPREQAPPWAGLHGSLALQFKNVVYSDGFRLTDVNGRLRLDAGMVKLEGLQAGLGETGHGQVSGALTFEPGAPQPYGLIAEIAVRDFDPAPLFRAQHPGQPPTLEGKFHVVSKVTGRAAAMGELASTAAGDFQVTSKGGLFRGFPLSLANLAENTSRLAALIASAGNVIGGLTGRRDEADIASRAQAVAEFARGMNPIHYDQLSVVLSRDAQLNTTLKDFALISPELRLSGTGVALHKTGTSFLEDSLSMEFKLRARGRQSEVLKYLGALEAQVDDLGYAACSVPLNVGGTIGRPDTSELNARLAALAVERGVADRAAELLAKLRK